MDQTSVFSTLDLRLPGCMFQSDWIRTSIEVDVDVQTNTWESTEQRMPTNMEV